MNEYFSVAIFVPRQCRKTTLSKTLSPSFSYVILENLNINILDKNALNKFLTRFSELLSKLQARINKFKKKELKHFLGFLDYDYNFF